MSFGLYIAGFIVLIIGLAWGRILLTCRRSGSELGLWFWWAWGCLRQ